MKVRSHSLSPSVARGIAVMCAAVFVASAHPAQAGVNVWTSHGPPGGGYGYVSALAIDPITPRTLHAALVAVQPGASGGVFKSTDAGVTWGAANAGLPGASALVIDPITPSTLYAVNGGVFKSTDAGATWANAGLTNPNLLVLAIDPITPSTLYAAGAATGIFKSTDAGATWGAAYVGIGNASVYALAIDPITPRTLYAAASNGYFKSTDGGSSWTQKVDFPGLPVFDPITPRTLYVGTHGEGVFKSTDGGSTWNALNSGLTDTRGAPSGAYVVALAIDPTEPRRVYAGTSGGVFAIEQISACVGDCNDAGTVTVDELLTMVNVALGDATVSECLAGDASSDGAISVDEILTAVNNALNGCEVDT